MALFSFNGNQDRPNRKFKKPKISIPEVETKDDDDNLESAEDYTSEPSEMDTKSEPDYESDYRDYLDFFNNGYHSFEGEPLTFEEFKAVNYVSPEFTGKLGFNILPSITSAARRAATDYATDRATRLTAAALSGNSNEVMNEIQDILDSGRTVINVLSGSSNDGNQTPPGVVPSKGNMKFASHSQLSLEPRPVEVSFNSGIEPNVYAPYDLDAVNYFSPMHISHAKIKYSKLLSGSKMSSYFQYVITFWFQIAAQRNVSFNVNAASTFTTANLLLYLDAITDALQIYYFYTSIITYCSNINNGNAAMRTLRSFMLSDDIDYLVMIRDRLQRMPIPPNLRTLIFWMNQNYQESSMPGSPIIKIMPMPFATSPDANYEFTSLNSNYILSVFNSLSNDNVNNIANLLAKIVPEWTKVPMDAPSGVALHDPQFNTLFSNLPFFGSSSTGSSIKTPSTTGPDISCLYSSFTNSLDGGILGLFSAYDTSVAAFTPSLLDTTLSSGYGTTRFTPRISYLYGASGKGFYPCNVDGTVPFTRGETYITTNAALAQCPYGAEQVLGVNVNAVSETGYQLLKWSLSLDSLESSTGGRSSNKSSPPNSSKSKKKKRYGKSSEADSDSTAG